MRVRRLQWKRRNTYQLGVARELVDHRVPDAVQIGDSSVADLGNVLEIATGVPLWVVVVDLRHCMQGLVDITEVVDHQAKGEASLVADVIKSIGNLLHVSRLAGRFDSFEEVCEVLEGVYHSLTGRCELRVV